MILVKQELVDNTAWLSERWEIILTKKHTVSLGNQDTYGTSDSWKEKLAKKKKNIVIIASRKTNTTDTNTWEKKEVDSWRNFSPGTQNSTIISIGK